MGRLREPDAAQRKHARGSRSRPPSQPCNKPLGRAGTNWRFPWRQMKCGGDNGAWAGFSCLEVIPQH